MAGCLVRLKEIIDNLPVIERKVAKLFLEHPESICDKRIDEISYSTGASMSSIVRLCKRMGYSGYKDFCRALSVDLALQKTSTQYEEIHPYSDLNSVVRNVCLSNMKAIENTMSLFNLGELEKAVNAMVKAKRIDFYGVSSSHFVAMDGCNKFLRINKTCFTGGDPHYQLITASTLTPNDVAVLVSYSGTTIDTIETMNVVKRSGATTISITKYGDTPLNMLADIRLYADSTETLLRSGAMSSRIGMLTIIDVLFTAVASKMYDEIKPFLDRSQQAIDTKRVRIK